MGEDAVGEASGGCKVGDGDGNGESVPVDALVDGAAGDAYGAGPAGAVTGDGAAGDAGGEGVVGDATGVGKADGVYGKGAAGDATGDGNAGGAAGEGPAGGVVVDGSAGDADGEGAAGDAGGQGAAGDAMIMVPQVTLMVRVLRCIWVRLAVMMVRVSHMLNVGALQVMRPWAHPLHSTTGLAPPTTTIDTLHPNTCLHPTHHSPTHHDQPMQQRQHVKYSLNRVLYVSFLPKAVMLRSSKDLKVNIQRKNDIAKVFSTVIPADQVDTKL